MGWSKWCSKSESPETRVSIFFDSASTTSLFQEPRCQLQSPIWKLSGSVERMNLRMSEMKVKRVEPVSYEKVPDSVFRSKYAVVNYDGIEVECSA